MRPLALGISVADVVARAKSRGARLDVERSARELYLRHFECGYSCRDIAGALRAEAAAAGVRQLDAQEP